MNKLTPSLLLLLCYSCATAKFLAPDLEVIMTKNGKNVGGTVVYNPSGMTKIVSMRRKEAIDRIFSACHPAAYKITREETAPPEQRNPKYQGNVKLLAGQNLRFLDYECISPYQGDKR